MSLEIKCYPRGKYGENTYIVTDRASGCIAVIDPGYYSDQLRDEIKSSGDLKYLLLTHGHDDHFLAVGRFLSDFENIIFAAPEKDLGLMRKCGCAEPSVLLKEGDVITLGETSFKVVETPGHTAGGICFLTDDEIFTGDTLFKLSVGRTDLESGDWDTLVHSISEKLYTLDPDLTVYPGHGVRTSIGYEKEKNPFV